MKLSGSYTLPFDILIAGTYQFSRGVQTGGAGPSIQANWAGHERASANPQIGRNWTGTASRTIQLIREGADYGDDNLISSICGPSKRVQLRTLPAARRLRRLQRVQQQLAVHGEHDLLDGGHEPWLRPTNVLQSRFFKFGGATVVLTRVNSQGPTPNFQPLPTSDSQIGSWVGKWSSESMNL